LARLLQKRSLMQGVFHMLSDRYANVQGETEKLREHLSAVKQELSELREGRQGQAGSASTQQVVNAAEENDQLRKQLTRLEDQGAVSALEQLTVFATRDEPLPSAGSRMWPPTG